MTGRRSPSDLSHDVRLWSIRKYAGKSTTYRVRWAVAGLEQGKSFATKALADRFLGELTVALNRGEAFSKVSGLPVSMSPTEKPPSWWEWSLTYCDLKWPDLAPNSRQSMAECLTTITVALLDKDDRRPDITKLRRAMLQWAFISPRRRASQEAPAEHTKSIKYLAAHTVDLGVVEQPATARLVLDALSRKLDGSRAAATTIARKRAVFFNALEMAIERGLMQTNPLTKVRWKLPKTATAIGPDCVVNPEQARALLAAVARVGADDEPAEARSGKHRRKGESLVAFFACMYYAGLRPSEAVALRASDLILPDKPGEWGELRLSRNDPEVGAVWTDKGRREARQLKHRAQGEVRVVPCAPPLVAHFKQHLERHHVLPGGLIFTGARGAPVSETLYSEVWQTARRLALGDLADGPMAGRPYDLRHSCVSTWLAAGVDSAQIASWVGHSVAVLHRVYAHVLPGRAATQRERIEKMLKADD